MRAEGAPDTVLLRLDGFEGPLDLLLHLARRQAVDLARMSVLDLADQYLAATADLGRVGLQRATDWLVMAAWLTWLKSRLLLPRSPKEAAEAEQAAAALSMRLARMERVRAAVAFMDAQPQLGRDAWTRGGRSEAFAASPKREGSRKPFHGFGEFAAGFAEPELASLFRACLAALRRPRPAGSDCSRPPPLPLWRVPDALALLRQRLGGLAEAGGTGAATLARFLPRVPREPPRYELRCRAALASTLVASLELARTGEAALEQDGAWAPVSLLRAAPPTAGAAAEPRG